MQERPIFEILAETSFIRCFARLLLFMRFFSRAVFVLPMWFLFFAGMILFVFGRPLFALLRRISAFFVLRCGTRCGFLIFWDTLLLETSFVLCYNITVGVRRGFFDEFFDHLQTVAPGIAFCA